MYGLKKTNKVDGELKKLIEKSLLIDEKRKKYTPNVKVKEHYLKEWRNVRTLLTDTTFDEMLEIEDITLHEFSFLLQPFDDFEYESTDNWFDEFLRILNGFPYDTIDYTDGVVVPALPLLYFLNNKLNSCIEKLVNITIDKQVLIAFIEAGKNEMFNILGKLIALELEIYKQEKSFISTDKSDRFKEFVSKRFDSKEKFLEFFAKYPVAARLAMVRIQYLKANFESLLMRLNDDSLEISRFLNMDNQNLYLTNINVSTGDSHQQGNAVTILHFEDKKMVYKPRNLKISESFQTLLNWCYSKSNLLDLKIPKGLYYETYTYQEYIQKSYCLNQKDVETFYTRYGYMVAICYLLGINDLHLENVIAMGEYPVIIDIETMFQPKIKYKDERLYEKLRKELELNSVMNSCLLPTKLFVGIEGHLELSALNGKEAKLEERFFGPANINTDQFRYEKQKGLFKGADNIPMLNEHEEVDYKQYLLRIVDGFDDFMQFIIDFKTEFIEMLAFFKNKNIRMLAKGTEQYATLIRYANHPNYNIEMKYRERLMMNAWAFPYADKRLIKSEVRDLIFNDIPIFFAKTDSRDIVDSQGNVYHDYFDQSGFDDALNRVQDLSKNEIEMQRIIMITSLGIANSTLNESPHMLKVQDITQHFDYIRETERIAEILISKMNIEDTEASFINVDCDKNKYWKAIPCDESLYGGLSGIATFFLLLHKKTKKENYLEYYLKLLRTSINQAESMPILGGFGGRLSPIYPMLLEYKEFGAVYEKDYLKRTIKAINELSDEAITNIEDTDYLSGIAGLVVLMEKLKLVSHLGSISKDISSKVINILNDRINRQGEFNIDRVGIAHGLSGLAYALSSLQNPDILLIEHLLDKEMAIQVIKEDSYKWCWGLSGMIQARIEIIKQHPSLKIEQQLSDLIVKYAALFESIPNDDTLCHGNGSILTTLKCIFEYTGDEKWHKKMQVLTSNMRQRSMIEGYGVKRLFNIQAKGLFDGLSGVGFSYLYALGAAPNILLLNE